MADDFAYDGSKIVVANGTSGSPKTVAEMFSADLNGTLELLAAWNPNNNTKVLGTQVQPADEKGLKIDFVVAAKTADADFIFIMGTDINGNPQTESLDVTAGNGTYTTTKWFQTITNIDCSDNAAGGGAVWADGTIQVIQNRWGVVHAKLGPELVSNGRFDEWADDDPTGWTVTGEVTTDPEISEVGTGEGHGGAGTGMCNIYTTSDNVIMRQNITVVIGRKYRFAYTIDTIIGGAINIYISGTTVGSQVYSLGFNSTTFVATQTSIIVSIGQRWGSTDITLDNVSIREVLPQYKIDCDVDFGDTSNSTYFQSTKEMVYFEDGKVFIITDEATLELGDLDNGYGIDGSYWSLSPSPNLEITAYGTTGIFYLYDSTLRSRDKDLHFVGGTIVINKGKLVFDIGTEKPYFKSTIDSLSIKGLYVVGDYLYINKQPTDFEDVHVHNSINGFRTDSTLILDGFFVTNASTADVYQGGANTLIIKNPKFHPSTVIITDASGEIIEQYTCNIHVTDKDGADLQNVDVDCEYAHLVEGTNGTYKCIQDHTSVDATHKPETGTNWNEFWELYDAGGGLGGIWQATFDFKAGAEEFAQDTTDGDGDISEQIIQYKKWAGDLERLEARIHKFTFSHADYPDFVMSDIIADHPLVWEFDMGQSTSDLAAIMSGELATYDGATGSDLVTAAAAIITEVDANETKIDANKTILDTLDGLVQDSGGDRFTEKALETAPTAEMDATEFQTALLAVVGVTEGGTMTLQKLLKIQAAWIAGNWQDKSGSDTVKELLDADNSTVILEMTLSETTPQRQITVKI